MASTKAPPRRPREAEEIPSWTFLTNHAHVLLFLAESPDARLREVALGVGITERAVLKIVSDLEGEGYLEREREGRRSHYRIDRKKRLRHPLERHRTIGALVGLVMPPPQRRRRA